LVVGKNINRDVIIFFLKAEIIKAIEVLINFDGMPGQKANIKKKDAPKMQTDAKCLLTKFKKP